MDGNFKHLKSAFVFHVEKIFGALYRADARMATSLSYRKNALAGTQLHGSKNHKNALKSRYLRHG
jgi:hypothetical protein